MGSYDVPATAITIVVQVPASMSPCPTCWVEQDLANSHKPAQQHAQSGCLTCL